MPVMEMSSQEAAAAIKMNARAAPFEAQPPKQTQHLRQRSRRSERGPMVEVNVFELAFRREVVRQRLAAQQELLLREQEFFQQQQQQQQQQHLPQQHQQQYRLQFELQQHLEQQQQQEQQQCAPETSRMETLPLHQTEAAIAYAQFGMPQKSLVELQQAHLEQQRQQLQLQLKREQAQELFAARAALHAQHQHQQQQLHQQSRAAYYNANNNAGMHRNAWGGSGRDEAGWEQQDVQNANLNAHPLVPPPCDDNDDEHDDGYDAEDDEPTGMDDDDLPPLDPNSVAGQRVALASGCLVELQQFLLLMLAVWNRSSQSGATDNPVSAIEIAAAVEHDAVMSVVHLADHLPVEFSISAPSAMPLEDLEALVARHFQSCSGNSAVVAMLNQMKAGAPRLLLSTQGSHVVLTLRIASPKACQLDSEVIYRVPQQTRTLRQQHDDICTVTRMAQLYSVFSNTTAPNVTCTVQVYHELDVAHAAFVDRIAVRIQGIFVGVVDRSQMNEKTRVLFSCSEVPQGMPDFAANACLRRLSQSYCANQDHSHLSTLSLARPWSSRW
ncbi:hypothetical protein, variant [Capsaspora owczarzaki ATCC 30864]|uniref:Uncharacterized protein n=1 Tax=Capsaspora owczarzaki (strain ATCC 30864) TaxID=595528 RepID=A0A0D2X2N5_CAPO3|nr:hypothetical protein, variant [Capsaspora owczarzaki ATCC 30864]